MSSRQFTVIIGTAKFIYIYVKQQMKMFQRVVRTTCVVYRLHCAHNVQFHVVHSVNDATATRIETLFKTIMGARTLDNTKSIPLLSL